MGRSLLACLALCVSSVLAPSLAPVHAESGMRCGSKLVGQGDSTYRVRQLCGDPVEARTHTETRRVAAGRRQRADGSFEYIERTVEVPIDTWLYDFGSHKFMRRVTFEHGLLVHVETGSYGSPR
jgi:hypothetical protein